MGKATIALITVGSIFAGICSTSSFGQNTTKNVKQTVTDVKADLFQLFDKNSLDVNFAKGMHNLSDGEKSDIIALIKSQKDKITDQKIVIAAWSDQEYPLSSKNDLKKDSIELADKRLEVISRYILTSYKFGSVEKLNMAKHENRLLKWWGTDVSQVKDAVKDGKSENAWVEYEADVIKRKGGPSKAAILIYKPQK